MSRATAGRQCRILQLVPAGGAGSRLRPHTLSLPKPLFPIGGHRLIDFALKDSRLATRRLVTVQRGMGELEAYIRARYHGVVIARENQASGTAGALRSPVVRDLLATSDMVLVTPADHVSVSLAPFDAVRQLLAIGLPVGQIVVSPRVPYGDSVAVDGFGRIESVSTDPRKHPFSSTGIFIFSSAYLRQWLDCRKSESAMIDFYRDIFLPACANGQCLGIRQSPHLWDDAGTPERYWLNAMLLAGGLPVYSSQAPRAECSHLRRCVVIGEGDLQGRTFTDSIISWSTEGALQVTRLTIHQAD
jgi:NDP-sugar pyrophosphorylase family protein